MTVALNRPSSLAQALGYGGLIPFVGLAALVWLPDAGYSDRALAALLGYGVTILSFLGAIHWGFLMRDGSPQPSGLLLWGVLPSLLGWVALLLGTVPGLWLVAAGLWACFLVDRVVYPQRGASAWLPMRLMLTVVASLACATGALGVLR